MASISLDICTPEGKTWLAAVTGIGGEFGLEREFVSPIERHTSRSGATGTAVYEVGDGIYESSEGRKRLGRRFWRVDGQTVTSIDRADVVEAFK
jgi:hypothetical protein